mgnify:CR=1 FL=1
MIYRYQNYTTLSRFKNVCFVSFLVEMVYKGGLSGAIVIVWGLEFWYRYIRAESRSGFGKVLK